MIASLLVRMALLLTLSGVLFASTALAADPDDDLFAGTLGDEEEDEGSVTQDEDESEDGDSGGDLFDPDTAEADGDGDTQVESQDDEETAPADDDAQARSLRLQASIGGGIGMRGFRRPVFNESSQVLPDQLFPVADLGLRAVLWPDAKLSLAITLQLQTSVFGFKIKDSQPLTDAPVVDARADRLELLVAPSLRLGDGPDSLRVALGVGGALRSLWHRRHELNIPRYSLVGALVRPQLWLPLGAMYLRVGPEFQFIFMMDEALIDQGAAGTALCVGVDLTVGLRINELFALEAAYRESYTRGAGEPVDLEESERHVTARLVGTL